MIIGYKIPTHTPCKSTLDAWSGGKVQQEIFKRAYDTFNMRFLNSVKSFWLGEGGGDYFVDLSPLRMGTPTMLNTYTSSIRPFL